MENAESAPNEYDGYYQFSPLGFLDDSYSHISAGTQYRNQETGNPGQAWRGTNFAAPVPRHEVSGDQPYQSPNPMDLSLLSAENYQEGSYGPMNQGRRDPQNVLYGGLLANDSRESAEPEHQMNTRSRRSLKKDSSKKTNVEDDLVRPRGRPRLDTKDRTAAERRRTQIRLAQRAYRQRKETTISGLSKRVALLERTINNMHNAFLAFNESAITSNIQKSNPALAEHLKETSDRLADLATNSIPESNASEEELDQPLEHEDVDKKATQTNPQQSYQFSGPRAVGYHSMFDEKADPSDGETAQQASHAQVEETPEQTEIFGSSRGKMAHSLATQSHHGIQSCNVNIGTQYNAQTPGAANVQGTLPFGFIALPKEQSPINYDPSYDDFSGLLTLPSPNSYASQEVSFTRRLIRSSLEEAYRLVTDPLSRPEDVQRLCRFTRCFTTTPRISQFIKTLIQRSSAENLEWWQAPAWHIGGAGLHYPRCGIDASGSPPEGWAAEAPIGPLPPLKADTPMPSSMTPGQIAEKVGCDGEWFDSNDVEQYLRDKGLYLDGVSSIVELNEDAMVPSLADASTSASDAHTTPEQFVGPQTPQDADMDLPNDPFKEVADPTWGDYTTNTSSFPELNFGSSWEEIYNSGQTLSTPAPEIEMSAYPTPSFGTKMKKFIDVEKFVNTIIKSGVCLGRTPAFRKAAVDAALILATF